MLINPAYVHVLEYRINDEQDYPAIYHLKNLEPIEIFARQQCEFFILEGKVYKVSSTALEHDRYVIYVVEDEEEKPFYSAAIHRPLGVEVRLFHEHAESPEMTFVPCDSHAEVFAYISNTFNYLHHNEYERVAAELDQDRRTYVLYVEATGVTISSS